MAGDDVGVDRERGRRAAVPEDGRDGADVNAAREHPRRGAVPQAMERGCDPEPIADRPEGVGREVRCLHALASHISAACSTRVIHRSYTAPHHENGHKLI